MLSRRVVDGPSWCCPVAVFVVLGWLRLRSSSAFFVEAALPSPLLLPPSCCLLLLTKYHVLKIFNSIKELLIVIPQDRQGSKEE